MWFGDNRPVIRYGEAEVALSVLTPCMIIIGSTRSVICSELE
jgi:hypothetical protein